jgi:site-specific DNA-methyltransferase (adenine-specific)
MSEVKLYLGDCAKVMSQFDDGCIDLTVTSPPYDNLRTYNGYVFDFEAIAQQLCRVTKPGGVVVWVVGDATINGSETGTSFRQALYFMELGFSLHDTMIYQKAALSFPSPGRYYDGFEFMFVFSKGKPNAINLLADRKNLTAGGKVHGTERKKDGTTSSDRACTGNITKQIGIRFNVWRIPNPGQAGMIHPAVFPEALARDHILSWSNPGDTVLDPMMGSGTTGKMAVNYQRNFIGIDISEEYYQIAEKRIAQAQLQIRMPL